MGRKGEAGQQKSPENPYYLEEVKAFMCGNNGFGGNGCLWIIIIIILLVCCCGGGLGGVGGCGNGCGGCGNGCGNGCGGCGC